MSTLAQSAQSSARGNRFRHAGDRSIPHPTDTRYTVLRSTSGTVKASERCSLSEGVQRSPCHDHRLRSASYLDIPRSGVLSQDRWLPLPIVPFDATEASLDGCPCWSGYTCWCTCICTRSNCCSGVTCNLGAESPFVTLAMSGSPPLLFLNRLHGTVDIQSKGHYNGHGPICRASCLAHAEALAGQPTIHRATSTMGSPLRSG